MKQGWEIIPFEDSIVKVKYTTKIPSNDYLEQGLYPIVSQEEGLISGYWDNANDVFEVSTPVVIFGDHTRILKYVDFDFVLGADGVKILQPIKSIDAKFFKLYLESCKIPSLGYSRHYKLLKELHVPIPPREDQERIVEELDCLSGVIEKKREQLKELDALAQSIFYQMFGDPITNEKGWEVKKFEDCYKLASGNGLSAKQIIDGDYPVYGGNGIVGYHHEYNLDGNNIIIGRVGALCGNVRNIEGKAFITDNAFILTKKIDNDNVFLLHLLRIHNLRKYAREAMQPVISNAGLKNIDIIITPIALQYEFADKIEAIEKQKELIKESIKETETLFNARMDYYFN